MSTIATTVPATSTATTAPRSARGWVRSGVRFPRVGGGPRTSRRPPGPPRGPRRRVAPSEMLRISVLIGCACLNSTSPERPRRAVPLTVWSSGRTSPRWCRTATRCCRRGRLVATLLQRAGEAGRPSPPSAVPLRTATLVCPGGQAPSLLGRLVAVSATADDAGGAEGGPRARAIAPTAITTIEGVSSESQLRFRSRPGSSRGAPAALLEALPALGGLPGELRPPEGLRVVGRGGRGGAAAASSGSLAATAAAASSARRDRAPRYRPRPRTWRSRAGGGRRAPGRSRGARARPAPRTRPGPRAPASLE